MLELVVKDVNGDRVGTWRRSVPVPDYNEDRLATSSLVVADDMHPVATRNVGTGNFVIGVTYVLRLVPLAAGRPAIVKCSENLKLRLEVHHLRGAGKPDRL